MGSKVNDKGIMV